MLTGDRARVYESNSMTLNRSPGLSALIARRTACFACVIDTPCMDPEVSMMKMVSRGWCTGGALSWSGGMTMSRWYGWPAITSVNAMARGSDDVTGCHTSSKSWSIGVVESVSATV